LTRCALPLFSHSLVVTRFALDVRAVQRQQKIRAGTEGGIGKKRAPNGERVRIPRLQSLVKRQISNFFH
jgi:hypothetical protein